MADVYSSEHIRNSRQSAEENRSEVEGRNEERRELGVSTDSFHGVHSVSHNKTDPKVKPHPVRGTCDQPPTSVNYRPIRWL